jgi:hypothetical protein
MILLGSRYSKCILCQTNVVSIEGRIKLVKVERGAIVGVTGAFDLTNIGPKNKREWNFPQSRTKRVTAKN